MIVLIVSTSHMNISHFLEICISQYFPHNPDNIWIRKWNGFRKNFREKILLDIINRQCYGIRVTSSTILCKTISYYHPVMKFSFFNLCISFAVFKISNSQRPLVLIHGLLGSFKDFDNFTEMVQADFPDITILPLDAFNGRASWVSIVQQISWFSRLVEKITQKYEDITLLGYSQGGFIARGILEMSDNPHIHTLISLAGPG